MNRNKLAALAGSVIAIVGAVVTFGLSSPANAGVVYNCDENYVCMFDGTNYGTFNWREQSLTQLAVSGCINLPANFNNVTSSVIVNPSNSWTGTKRLRFYMNANCTGTPTPSVPLTVGLQLDPDLTNGGFGVSTNWSNALTSIGFS